MPVWKDRAPLLVLLASACVIAFAAVLVRMTTTGPAAAGFWRLATALPWLTLLLLRTRRRAGRERDRHGGLGAPLPIMIAAGLTFSADLVCWHYSLRLTSVANSTVLANMTPVVVTLLAWVVLRERPAHLFLAGLALAVGGAAVMASARHSGGSGSDAGLGDLLALITTVWYALYFLSVSAARRTASAVQVMFGSSLIGAPVMLLAAWALHEGLWPRSAGGWAACVALGAVHVAGQGGVAWALGKVPTALAAVVVLVQPVFAALLSWMLFGEAVTPVQAIGGLLALAGVAVAQLSTRKRTPPGEDEAVALSAET